MRITETSAHTRFPLSKPDQDMTGTYPVEWRALFAALALLLSITFVGGIGMVIAGTFVKTGFNAAKTFGRMSPWDALLLLFGMLVLAVVIAFVVAMVMRLAKITVTDKTIQGVNYWGLKRRIPLGEITSLGSFSQNGVRAIVVNSHRHGQVYISDKTHRLRELLQFLNATIAENQKAE